MALALPKHWDKDTVSTLFAGVLIAVIIKKLIINVDEIIFGFPLPEWLILSILVFVIYYLLGYGK